MEEKPCPYCKQTGFETVYNQETEENENITCTGCWGNLVVDQRVYNNYFVETGKQIPDEIVNYLFGEEVVKNVITNKTGKSTMNKHRVEKSCGNCGLYKRCRNKWKGIGNICVKWVKDYSTTTKQ